jgi:hypothetical protein
VRGAKCIVWKVTEQSIHQARRLPFGYLIILIYELISSADSQRH